MKLTSKNYRERPCAVCKEIFKPDHPRLVRCHECREKAHKCSICNKPISSNHAQRQKKNPDRVCKECDRKRWKYRYLNRDGYVVVVRDGKRKLEHRVVMEEFVGRELLPEEIVHHINGDRSDNRIENLQLCFSIRVHLHGLHSDILKPPPKHHFGKDGKRAREYFLMTKIR